MNMATVEEMISLVPFLSARGYGRSSFDGEARNCRDSDIGILDAVEPRTERRFFGFIKRQYRRRLLAAIVLKQGGQLLDPGTFMLLRPQLGPNEWIMHIYGTDRAQEMESLAKEIGAVFGVSVSTHIKTAGSLWERFFADYADSFG